jgi:hypothetical protein
MILRRFAQSLNDQNWATILIEFILLVLGVFLGIQVANWNAQRVEDAKAQAYLVRIHNNLESDLQSIERRIAFWQKVSAYGKQAIRYAEHGEKVNDSAWKTVLAFYQASQLWQWAPVNPTYLEMRSGGELGLIRDPILREALSAYYFENGAGSAFLFDVQPEYRKIVRGLTPQVVADHIWTKCWQQTSAIDQLLLDCESPISEAEAQTILENYFQDPRLVPELRFWVANQGVALKVIQNFKPVLKDMLEPKKPEPMP